MTGLWLRRAVLAAACASAAVLSACGSSDIASAITPNRFVVFGDGLSDLGQTGTKYTVNDGTSDSIWTQKMVASFGKTLTTASQGGLSFAQGNARVTLKPDAAGNNATPTIQEQISRFQAQGGSWSNNDIALVNGGTSDIITQFMAYRANQQTEAQLNANVRQAGKDLGVQVRRLVQSGAKYVAVMGTYNLGKTPWAIAMKEEGRLGTLSTSFNDALLVEIVDLGANVLYLDAAYQINLMVASPGSFGMVDSSKVACTSLDTGAGIGTGTNQVNSALCTPSTIASGVNYTQYMFADAVHLTPVAQRQLGDYAYNKLRGRW